MKLRKIMLASLLALLLAACQQEEQPEKTEADSDRQAESVNNKEQEKDGNQDIQSILADKELIKIPETAQDLINQPVGEIGMLDVSSGDEKEIKDAFFEAFGDVPALPKDASPEEMDLYFNYIYSIAAYDFQDPQNVVDQLEFSLSGTPETDPRFSFKENYNIEIILDASGSMANYIGNETRMELAKKAIRDFVAKIPEEANVSLRVYGHEGTGSEADKAASCAAIDEVYKRGSYNQSGFEEALNTFEPAGWTPVAGALESAKASFTGLDSETNTNFIYLVSDGIETCGGDPVAVARSFAESAISPIINVIGFNADAETQQQLKDVAEAAAGIFSNVTNGDQLTEQFEQSEKVLENWKAWKSDSEFDVLEADNDSWLAITQFDNRWYLDSAQQEQGLERVARFLQDDEYITSEQRKYLSKKAAEIRELSNETNKQIMDELNSIKQEGLDSMRKKIDEQYPKE